MERQTFTAVYPHRMRFSQYDGAHFLVYINEAPAQYKPDEESEAVPGFAYTGDQSDGGTLIECDALDRDKLINGIVRTRYLQTEEDAIKTHQIQVLQSLAGLEAGEMSEEKAADYAQEWAEFQAFRQAAIEVVTGWLEEE